jgi:CBS domain-containing protein
MATILVRDVMTVKPIELPASATLSEAARAMRDANIGAVLVTGRSGLAGIVTDRDLVVRAVAEGKDPQKTTLEHICSSDITALSPDDPIHDAVALMRKKSVRRLPVIEDDSRPVGILSLGDLAQRLDPASALGEISAARPNR